MVKVKLSNRQWTYLKHYAPFWFKKIVNANSIMDIKGRSFDDIYELDLKYYNSCISGELNAWTSGYTYDL